jgi:hypothetical protein
MKLKSTLFAAVLTASLVAPAFANEEAVAAPLPQFTAADTKMLFEQDAMPMQLAALSPLEMKETEGAAAPMVMLIAAGFQAFNYARYAVGPVQAWVRTGPSFSQTSQTATNALRWGSNAHHQRSIGSDTLRNLNNSLHNTRLPGNSWRVQDRGHFHLSRR